LAKVGFWQPVNCLVTAADPRLGVGSSAE